MGLAVAFAHAALRYWLTVFALVRRETRRWTKRAGAIPDPVLRRIALETQRDEHGNYEGAGAFATFVPLRRRAVALLPSWDAVACPARAMARLVAELQARNHADRLLIARHLTALALRVPKRGGALQWWEAAAGSASSLGVFALIAASARPRLTAHEAAAIHRTYLPWIGALHVLLDSLVDWPRDVPAGHHSLVANYASRSEMAEGMGAIADAAVRGARCLPRAREHELLLVAMAGLYLARPAATLPHAKETTARIISALGELAWPVLLVHRVREQITCVADRN